MRFYASNNRTDMFINRNTGNVSINNTNNTYKLDVTGDVNLSGQLR